MKKILVIDGNSIINRAFYGVRPLTTKDGRHTNAIFGMINIITRQMDRIKPDYAVAAFDLKHPTFRHEMYAEYKAGRHATPEELLSQFADAKECLSLMGINVMELPGFEADDIQGTVARMAHTAAEPTESYILSGDRDLLQLIDDKTTVLLATNSDTLEMHRDEFFAKYGIEPELFVEMKALMGDSSDNIPGVAGIGEKTAAALISDFGTLESIYESIDDPRIKKGVREKLLRDKDAAFLSRTLAKISTDAPIGRTLDELAYRGISRAGLYRKFSELELNSLIVKMRLDAEGEGETPSGEEYAEPAFREASAEELIASIPRRYAAELSGDVLYLYYNEENLAFSGDFSVVSALFSGTEIVCYDGKRLWHELDRRGVDPTGARLLDLQLYEYVISPGGGSAGVSSLAASFLGKSVSREAHCPELLLSLEEKLREKINADGLTYILDELELPLLPVLARVEKWGFKIDSAGISEFRAALLELAEELADKIYMQAGEVFNLNSPKQLAAVLYDKMGLPAGKKHSTDAETLESLRHASPIIDDILEYRQVTKLVGTYTTALTDVADENGRIHTDFKQALTATGRLSSAEPNLQNIPIRTKMGRELRRHFVAEDGYMLVDADYSQIELRLLAHICGDYNMCEAFRTGEDIHRKTAAAVFGVPEELVSEDMRKRAKAVNFGIVYGISGFSLAKDIGTSVPEASKYIKSYMYNYPGIDSYLETVVERAAEDGYTTTPFGRRRYIPELRSQNGNLRAFGRRVAMNAPIQGAAADVMKLAMIRVDKRLKELNLDARIVMQVHDELVVEARADLVDKVKQVLKEEMEGVASLSVPLTVDVTVGSNWLEQA
ncbi:MAG: DNA polymerase I [Clostridia bacterium]|nr:DNA polymerase I [Clostridia bacterium]